MHHSTFLLSRCHVLMAAMIMAAHGASMVDPTAMPSTMSGLTITSSATEVTPTVTNRLSLNCTFLKTLNPQNLTLISLIMSRLDKATNSMQEILTINSVNPHQVTELEQVQGKVSGAFYQAGDAFISIVWEWPTESVATKYICEFHAFDMVGHTLEATVGLEIATSVINLSDIVKELRLLKEWKAGQAKFINNVNNSQELQKKALNALANANTAQNRKLDVLTSSLEQQEKLNGAQSSILDVLSSSLRQQKTVFSAQNHTIDVLSNSLGQQEKVIAAQNNSTDVLTNTLEQQRKTIAAQNHTIGVLSTVLDLQVKSIADQDVLQHRQNLTIERLKTWVIGYNTIFKTVTLKRTDVVIDHRRLYWTDTGMDFERAQTLCWSNGGKIVEFAFEKLKAVASQLKASGRHDFWHWIGLTRKDVDSPWVWDSDGRDAGSVTWRNTPSSTDNCVMFVPGGAGYDATKCSYNSMYVICEMSE